MTEYTQEEAREMAKKLKELELNKAFEFVSESVKGSEDTVQEPTLQEKKEALQKLFTQTLATYGVLQFNIKALKVEEDKQFLQINDLKNKLDALNKEEHE